MGIIDLVFGYPRGFWLLAILLSAYYGIRGWVYQTIYRDEKNKVAPTPTWKRVVVWYVQDAIYNFICSMAGFIALFLLIRAHDTLNDWYGIEIGTATYLVFLTLLAVLGTSGVLPRMFGRGSFVGRK